VRKIVLLLFVSCSLTLFANKDSTRLRNYFAPYFQLGAHFGIGNAIYKGYSDKWGSNAAESELDRMNVKLFTPVFSVGTIYRTRKRMLKIDLGYFLAIKKYNRAYSGSGNTPNENVLSYYIDGRDVNYAWTKYIGSSHFLYKDTIKADVYFNYLDVNLTYGRNFGKHMSLLFGTRTNILINTQFDGTLHRQATEIFLSGGTYTAGYPQPVESVVGESYSAYNNSTDLKRLSGQKVNSNFYLNLGLQGIFEINERTIMIELKYDQNCPFRRNAYRNYLSASVGWIFSNFKTKRNKGTQSQ
jgi:hypothetical protein